MIIIVMILFWENLSKSKKKTISTPNTDNMLYVIAYI